MGFLETGFGIFAVIMVWNVLLLGSGAVPDAPFLTDQNFSGLKTVGSVDLDQINPTFTPNPYIATTTTPEENTPWFNDAYSYITETASFVPKVVFGGATAVENSGIPSPLNWILSFIIRIFMGGYIGLFLYTLVSGWKGGGVGGA